MIQAIMLITLGFLTASLIGVLIAPSLWRRAYRLSRKRLEKTLPLSLAEIEAAQDQLRASYAVKLRRLETSLATASQKAAMQLVENSRLQMQIAALRDTISDLELKLSERRNAATVLEQTIVNRVPELERDIANLSAQLQERSYELQDLTNRLSRKDEALEAAQRSAATHQEELNQLRQSLEKSSAGNSSRRLRRPSQWNIDDYRAEYDRLNLDLSRLRQQLAELQDRDLQQAAIMRSELQKLAELILSSTQPKPDLRSPERSEAVASSRRAIGSDVRRERPLPWPEAAPAAAGPASSNVTDASSALRDIPAKSVSSQAAESTQPAIPAAEAPALPPNEDEPSSAAAAGQNAQLLNGSASSPPKEGLEATLAKVTPSSSARSRIVREVAAKSSLPADKDTAREERNGASGKLSLDAPERSGPNEKAAILPNDPDKTDAPRENSAKAGADSQKAFSDARDLRAISELMAMNPASGTATKPPPRPTIAEEAKAGKILDLEPAKPVQTAETGERNAQHSRTLLDRLKGVAEERAEAEK
jgi:hypothetical protein